MRAFILLVALLMIAPACSLAAPAPTITPSPMPPPSPVPSPTATPSPADTSGCIPLDPSSAATMIPGVCYCRSEACTPAPAAPRATPTLVAACPGFEREREVIRRAMPELEHAPPQLNMPRQVECLPDGVSASVTAAAGHGYGAAIRRYATEAAARAALGTPTTTFRGEAAIYQAPDWRAPRRRPLVEGLLRWQQERWVFDASSSDDTQLAGRDVRDTAERLYRAADDVGLFPSP